MVSDGSWPLKYGNRSSMFVTGEGTTGYVYDKNNRLTKQTQSVNGVSAITEYWYDPNGNQISSMSVNNSLKDGTNTAVIELAGRSGNSMNAYNSWNQLTSTMQNGKTSSYTYNGDGLRMSKTVDGTTTSHMWDGTNIAGDVTNGTVTKYIRGLQLISSKTGSSESFYNYNAHGDVVQLTNSSGSITKQYSYDAFGVEQDKSLNDTNPFRYGGEYYDKETDNIYLRARYYSPVQGRFTTEDPAEDGLNWYSYCNGNPVGFVDPSGLKEKQYAHLDENGNSIIPKDLDWDGDGFLDTEADKKRFDKNSNNIADWIDDGYANAKDWYAEMDFNMIDDFPHNYQGNDPLCWAAQSSGIVEHLTGWQYSMLSISIDKISGAHMYGLGITDVKGILLPYFQGSRYEVGKIKSISVISNEVIKSSIDAGIPIYISGQEHARTIVGYDFTGGKDVIFVDNPGDAVQVFEEETLSSMNELLNDPVRPSEYKFLFFNRIA